MKSLMSHVSLGAVALLWTLDAGAATLSVGPGKTYAKPCAAFAAAADGDTIEIDSAGSYDGDVCAIARSNLTIKGVGAGRAKIDAAGQNAQGKGTWVVQGANTTIENIELSGAAVPDQNGAGIRAEGSGITIRNCLFRNNENGILTNPMPDGEVHVEHSEFDANGQGDGCNGPGCAHNLYINHVKRLVFEYNYSHGVLHSHTLKSRAKENVVRYNLFSTADGSGSYEIDFPNGGLSFVIGNVIIQGANSENPNVIGYRLEGPNADNPSDELFVVNNTFINEKSSGTFVNVDAGVTTPAVIRNNLLQGTVTLSSQASALAEANCTDPATFVDAAGFDFHLAAGSPCIDQGVDPGQGAGQSLSPGFHYVHPLGSEPRPSHPPFDAGAYEFGVPTTTGAGGNGAGGGAGSGGGATTGTGGNASGAGGGDGDGATDSGCGCSVAGEASRSAWAGFALLGLVLVARRRRESAAN